MATLQDLDQHFGLVRMAAATALVPVGLVVPPRLRAPALALAGAALFLVTERQHVAGLMIAACALYAAVHGLARVADARRRWRIAMAFIVLTSAVYLAGRAARLDTTYATIGPARVLLFGLDMWLVLRAVSLLWEVGSSEVAAPGPIAFAAWVLSPFTIHGPLVRPSEHLTALERPPAARIDAAWMRRVVVAGAMVGAAIAIELLEPPHAARPRWMRAALLLATPWPFYLSLGGYYSLMSVTSEPWGFAVPESFVRPFARRNLAEFWANWNATVTNLFRDYLFFQRWGRKGRPNAYLNAFIVFVLVGAWHDPHAFYVSWGVYHGVGYVVFLWFRSKKGALRRRFPGMSGRVGAAASLVLTYLFVCLSFTLPLFAIEAVRRVALHHPG
jgi:D-alanyl-lipoteichoic acid acyltransferase DltB (MBOAT superfamily)